MMAMKPGDDSTQRVGRKHFLKTGVTAGAAAVLLGHQSAVTAAADDSATLAASDGRSYVSGYFALSLDGADAGFVRSGEGGDAYAEVVVEKLGADHVQRKHLGNVKYGEFTVDMSLAMGQPVKDWIKATLSTSSNTSGRKNGELQAADFKRDIRQVTAFTQALITEIGMPACDGGAKDPAYMTLKFAPEVTRKRLGTGSLKPSNQKQWLPSNFRLEIAGLDCTKVNKIDAFTIKQRVTENAVGEQRDYELEATSVEVPNLAITLPEEATATWNAWLEDFVIKGNNDQSMEKSGRLLFLDGDGKTPLVEVSLQNLGIFRLAPDKSEANDDKVRRVKAELYCERMELKFPA